MEKHGYRSKIMLKGAAALVLTFTFLSIVLGNNGGAGVLYENIALSQNATELFEGNQVGNSFIEIGNAHFPAVLMSADETLFAGVLVKDDKLRIPEAKKIGMKYKLTGRVYEIFEPEFESSEAMSGFSKQSSSADDKKIAYYDASGHNQDFRFVYQIYNTILGKLKQGGVDIVYFIVVDRKTKSVQRVFADNLYFDEVITARNGTNVNKFTEKTKHHTGKATLDSSKCILVPELVADDFAFNGKGVCINEEDGNEVVLVRGGDRVPVSLFRKVQFSS